MKPKVFVAVLMATALLSTSVVAKVKKEATGDNCWRRGAAKISPPNNAYAGWSAGARRFVQIDAMRRECEARK